MEHLLNRFSFQYPFLSGFNSNIHFKVLNLFYRIGINTFHLVRAQTAIYFIVRSNLVRVNDVGTFKSISHCCQTYGVGVCALLCLGQDGGKSVDVPQPYPLGTLPGV